MLLKRYEFGFVFDHAKVVLAQGRAVKGEGLLSWKLSASMRGIVSNFLRGANARSGHISDHFPVLRSVYILWRSVNDILKIPELACPVSTTATRHVSGEFCHADPSSRRAPTFQLPPPTLEAITETKSRSEEHTSELQSLRHLVCRL